MNLKYFCSVCCDVYDKKIKQCDGCGNENINKVIESGTEIISNERIKLFAISKVKRDNNGN